MITTDILQLTCNKSDIQLAASKIKSAGYSVVYPTDTVYGIGCDPYNDRAVASVIWIKGRQEGKPMPLLCASVSVAKKIGRLEGVTSKLAENFWPGALTLVVELLDNRISRKVTSGTNSVGVRVPNNECALRLIDACGGVLVGTSANRSGDKPIRNFSEVKNLDGPDIIIDGGETPGGESTVLRVGDDQFNIIREGSVKREEINEILKYHV